MLPLNFAADLIDETITALWQMPTCAAVSSLALAIKSGGGLRRPRVTIDLSPQASRFCVCRA